MHGVTTKIKRKFMVVIISEGKVPPRTGHEGPVGE